MCCVCGNLSKCSSWSLLLSGPLEAPFCGYHSRARLACASGTRVGHRKATTKAGWITCLARRWSSGQRLEMGWHQTRYRDESPVRAKTNTAACAATSQPSQVESERHCWPCRTSGEVCVDLAKGLMGANQRRCGGQSSRLARHSGTQGHMHTAWSWNQRKGVEPSNS